MAQQALELALGAAPALLGCGLLLAAALHLIASIGILPDSGLRDVVAASPKALALLPRRAIAWAPHRPLRRAPLHRAPVHPPLKTALHSSARTAPRPPAVAQVRSTSPPRATQIVLRLAVPHGRLVPLSPPPVARKMLRATHARTGHREESLRNRLLPPLVGVFTGPIAVEPQLEGLRMRGRIVVPTPSPAPPYVPPVARNGLTPGP